MNAASGRANKPLSAPLVAIDPEAVIFAVAYNDYQERKGMIKLYDKNSFDGGPFSTFKISMEDHYDWKEIKFSPDGKLILCTTNGHPAFSYGIGTPASFVSGLGTPASLFSGRRGIRGAEPQRTW